MSVNETGMVCGVSRAGKQVTMVVGRSMSDEGRSALYPLSDGELERKLVNRSRFHPRVVKEEKILKRK